MRVEKITNNKYYNVYERNNSGMFVCISYYTVGQDGYTDELDFSGHKKMAIQAAKKLNKQAIKKATE